jgi:hypothetical protein
MTPPRSTHTHATHTRRATCIQVVDARDPLLYRCEDLEAYGRELHATKTSLLLLNKADLLPQSVRAAWARHLDKVWVNACLCPVGGCGCGCGCINDFQGLCPLQH